jgi:predicted lipoprotein with Yx(FWY)xxD motif
MRNRWQAAAGLAAVAFLATACGAGSSGTGSGYGSQPTPLAVPTGSASAIVVALKTAQTTMGTVLTSAGGYTLYFYTGDKRGSGTSTCTGSCASAWPPLTGAMQAPAGVAMPGPLGTITRADGTKQVTINGYPIYLYSGDHAPGQTTGNGVGGEWHVIKVPGPAAASSGSSSPAVSGSSGSGGGGGYGGGY